MSDLPSKSAVHNALGMQSQRQRLTHKRRESIMRKRTNGNSVLPAEKHQESVEMDPIDSITDKELELMKMTRKDLQDINSEDDVMTKKNRIKCMVANMQVKRMVISKLSFDSGRYLTGFAAWKYKKRLAWNRTKIKFKELSYKFELWRNSLKKIEGHFGSGVASYFTFLKWLLFLNIYIFLLVFIFVVVPQLAFAAQGYDRFVTGNTVTVRQNQSAICSNLYTQSVNVSSDAGQLVLDFLQGTGWMERTELFYGYYVNTRLSIITVGNQTFFYNMPLAYLLVTVVYLALSLVLMVRHTASGLKEALVDSEDKYYHYCNTVFGGWDYSMNAEKAYLLKHKSLYSELKGDLDEEKNAERRKNRTRGKLFCLWFVRLLINLLVLGMLAGSGYLIYYTMQQTTLFNERPDYDRLNQFVRLLMEYVPSLTITLLNIIVPICFDKMVAAEDYTPGYEIQITLGRTVFLRLASLGVLLATLYSQVTCSTKDTQCNVGVAGSCPPFRCWETYVGQQIYKLVILDFITVVIVTFFVEFPRRLLVDKVNLKLFRVIGKPQFQVPKTVLDLIYGQTLCWLGAFFSPIIPAICVIKTVLLFYMKKLTCLCNYIPSDRPYRASKSHSFFMIVLIAAFLLCCIPIGYIIWQLPPSYGCGPFRIYTYMYEIVTITIATWPNVIQQIISFIISAGFLFPFFISMCLLSYYFSAVSSARKEMVKLLKEQLVLEGRDKQFLLKRIQQLTGEGPPGWDPRSQREAAADAIPPKANPVDPPTAASYGEPVAPQNNNINNTDW